MPPKKDSQRAKSEKETFTLKKRSAVPNKSNASLLKDNEALKHELAEASEQQTALRGILRMIASSSSDLQSVFDAIAENAARLCDANDVLVHRVNGDGFERVSHFGSIPVAKGEILEIDRGSVRGRALIDRQTIHVPDLRAAAAEFPRAKGRGIRLGVRTALAVPLLRDGVPLGVIHIRRTEVRPFTDKQSNSSRHSPIKLWLPLRMRGFFRSVRHATATFQRSMT